MIAVLITKQSWRYVTAAVCLQLLEDQLGWIVFDKMLFDQQLRELVMKHSTSEFIYAIYPGMSGLGKKYIFKMSQIPPLSSTHTNPRYETRKPTHKLNMTWDSSVDLV